MRIGSGSVVEIFGGKTDDENSFDPAQIQYDSYDGTDDGKQVEIRAQYDTTGYPGVNP